MTDATKPLDISKAYVPEEERVLDPTLIDAAIIDRLPQPTGWRVLLLPFKGRTRSKGGIILNTKTLEEDAICLLYTSPSPRDGLLSRMPSSA